MKKALKIFGILVLVGIVSLAAAPYLFKDKIIALIKETINNNVNASVDFSNADLSLLKSFPKARIQLDDVSVTTFQPFQGDTLFFGNEVVLKLNINELFKSTNEQLKVNAFNIDGANVNIMINKEGVPNYNIAKPSENSAPNTSSEKSSLGFSIDAYEITNTNILYKDQKSNTFFALENISHSGSGDLSLTTSELDTKTKAIVSLGIGDATYLKQQQIELDALLGIDLNSNTYRFLKNQGKINQLPLVFDGAITLHDTHQELAINFSTPSSDFKNFLAVLPEAYSKNIRDVATTGDFKVAGKIQGIVDEHTIPKIDIAISSNNASFKYPELPKRVENIHIDASLKNTSGKTKDTYVAIDKLSFKIDEDTFNGNGNIKHLTTNPYVQANIDGTLNLANISKAYPITLKNELQGIIDAKLSTSFDMKAIENNVYDRIKNTGKVTVSDFVFSSKDIVNPINISETQISFTPKTVSLNSFDAITGDSDLKASGTIDNLLGFLLSDKELKGNFNVNSNTFKVSDFMIANEEGSTTNDSNTTEGAPLKIPKFLNCTITAAASNVYYDNLTLKDVKGILILKDEKAKLKDMKSSLFDGSIALNGEVNTQKDQPTFTMNLGLNAIDIASSFEDMDLFQSLTPIAKMVQGKLNTALTLSGDLSNNYTPVLNSLTGNALAEILTSTLLPEKSEMFQALNKNIAFFDLKKLNLEKLKTKLSFENGTVSVAPFDITYDDITITVKGSHGFDKTMNYETIFNVPAKYLGNDVGNLLAKLNDDSLSNTTVPINASIQGTFSSPQIRTNLAAAVSQLTQQLLNKQKDKIIDNVIGDVLGNKKDDTTSTQTSTPKVTDVIEGIIGGPKTNNTKKDSTSTQDVVKDVASDILGGILGGKKKKKDSTNNK